MVENKRSLRNGCGTLRFLLAKSERVMDAVLGGEL
jgi:hypothetical protein